MPAYLLAIRRSPVRDGEALAEYQRRTRELRGPVRPRPLAVYGALDALEGEAPEGLVLLEFPSREAALAWYHGEDYQAAVPFRQRAADYDVFIVEGLPDR